MDEMTLVRDLRSDAPHFDRSHLAAGRQELMNAAQHRGRVRRVRAGWQLATVGAAVVLTVAALLGSQLWGGDHDRVTPGSKPAYFMQLGSAKGTLEDAADVVAHRHAPVPHDGQWIYTVENETNVTDGEHTGLQEREDWTRYADPAFEHGRMGDDHSPRERYHFLVDLPHDLDAVKAKARAFYPGDNEPRPEHDLRALSALASSYPAPAEGLATVYRAMATIPRLKAAQTTDVLGRNAIALYLPTLAKKDRGSLSLQDQFLIDAETYAYLGHRSVALTDYKAPHGGSEDLWKKGDVVIDIAKKEIALVDKEGERP